MLWVGVPAATALYSTSNPGQITISAALNGDTTTARFIQVQSAVENRSIRSIQLHVNDASQLISVAGGQFAALVPLTRSENVIQASVVGAAANLVPGSRLIRVAAQIAPADIWSALTWDGAGDIDLHLVLPNGGHCFYGQRAVGGAILDFDNTITDGPEHIVMEKATPGKYHVQVVYYSQAGPPRNVHWSVDLRLRDGQNRYTFSGMLERVGEVQNVTAFSFP